MKNLVYLQNDEPVCSSLQVADKFEKRHDRVLRAIDNLLESLPQKWGGLKNVYSQQAQSR